MAFYSRRHFARVAPKEDTPEEAAERARHRRACEQALLELQEKFPVITTDNFAEADRFREQRTQELLRSVA